MLIGILHNQLFINFRIDIAVELTLYAIDLINLFHPSLLLQVFFKMSNTTKKRTLDAFFKPPPKKAKVFEQSQYSNHQMYPFPIAHFPDSITTTLKSLPSATGKEINDQPDLDLVYYQPYIPKSLERRVFEFLRDELPFYRVEYNINRGGTLTQIKTPRYVTVCCQ